MQLHIYYSLQLNLYFAEQMMLDLFNHRSSEPVEQPEELLHASPTPDLRPGLGLLAQLDQNPGDAPQQLDLVAQQQAEEQRQPLQLSQLIPDLLYRRQEPQQLHAHPGWEVPGSVSPALGSAFTVSEPVVSKTSPLWQKVALLNDHQKVLHDGKVSDLLPAFWAARVKIKQLDKRLGGQIDIHVFEL